VFLFAIAAGFLLLGVVIRQFFIKQSPVAA
jgi:hypothetical protein